MSGEADRTEEIRAYVSGVLESAREDMASMFAAARLDAGEDICEMWIDKVWTGLRERLDDEQRLTAIVLLLMGDAAETADRLSMAGDADRV